MLSEITIIVLDYILVVLATIGFIIAWENTGLKKHVIIDILNFFRKKDRKLELTKREDVENYTIAHWSAVGELINCPICLSVHVSLFFSIFFVLFGILPTTEALVFPFTLPLWVIILQKKNII